MRRCWQLAIIGFCLLLVAGCNSRMTVGGAIVMLVAPFPISAAIASSSAFSGGERAAEKALPPLDEPEWTYLSLP
ncbi:MAG: hypothetical protein EXQ85_00165 [Alphaproteobacteria bacterium]|nr:hypothetical protein [Alphaproteobacteria bacterium]